MDKEKILQVLKESYENKAKVNKEKLTKFIEDTTPFINTLDKDLDYYRILYYRLALVLELDLEVKGMDRFTEMEYSTIGKDLCDCIRELDYCSKAYNEGKESKEGFEEVLRMFDFHLDLALDTKEGIVLNYIRYYADLKE